MLIKKAYQPHGPLLAAEITSADGLRRHLVRRPQRLHVGVVNRIMNLVQQRVYTPRFVASSREPLAVGMPQSLIDGQKCRKGTKTSVYGNATHYRQTTAAELFLAFEVEKNLELISHSAVNKVLI